MSIKMSMKMSIKMNIKMSIIVSDDIRDVHARCCYCTIAVDSIDTST